MSDQPYNFRRRKPGEKPANAVSSENLEAEERRARNEARDKASRERRQAKEKEDRERRKAQATAGSDRRRDQERDEKNRRKGVIETTTEEGPSHAAPEPAALSSDQLLRRIVELESMVAALQKPGNRFGHRQSIFPARITSGAQWVEQTMSDGELADITSGGRACTSNADACAYIDAGESIFLYEIKEGSNVRYVRISGGGGGGSLDPGTLTGQVYQMVTDNNAAWQFPTAHSVD